MYALQRISSIILRKYARSLHSQNSSTIFALSSGHGKCGVAVIRVSGSETREALKHLAGFSALPEARKAILRSIKHPNSRETLDKGLVLWFPGPHSFTGEDCCEFHVHGGIAVVNSVLSALLSINKLRLAEPGEFTRRAFYNGKLDLTEVEGLADLLQAETEAQRKQAFLQTQGALSKLYNKWRGVLIRSVAHIEAHIDFGETETIEDNIINKVSNDIAILSDEIRKHLKDGRRGELLRSGVKTVIIGEPNVGKSSLLNLLCQRPAAIVTPIEGTTRDVLEVTLNIGGYPLILTDTAGLRSKTDDIIEKEGINRAIQKYKDANFVLLVIDATKLAQYNPIEDYIIDYMRNLGLNNEIIYDKQTLIVCNKVDLIDAKLKRDIDNLIWISCKNEEGVIDLVSAISAKLKSLCGEPSEEHPSMNQARHKQHLTNCLDCLLKSTVQNDTVLTAEYLRKSLKHLGFLIGVTTTEQLLDVIFKDFCIGK